VNAVMNLRVLVPRSYLLSCATWQYTFGHLR
jgi:hypothetical protein